VTDHPDKELHEFGKKWVLTAIGIYVFALLIGQEVDPFMYFGAFVGVPYATFYGFVAYEKLKSRRR